ncbi:LuxR family transcriptional regulator [Blastomonas sp. AAP53]|uniref:LuxR family transcriptional regulator n=1 Tax=Blastomonas sp. AAP53 TaxID=1248760 RepID=UPI00030D109B|nr:LuxR family transcriptional regulator [Blastomonas sp. AAP53]
MPELDLVERASAAIEAATSLEALLHATAEAARPFGFAYAALARHVHVQSGLMKPEMVTNYPETWHDLFQRRDYSLTSPILAACQRRGGAIRWSDLSSIIPLTRIQREYLEEMRKMGLGSGCTIASHMPDHPTISVHFVVEDGQDLKPRPFMLAMLIGAAAGQQARTLWQSQLPEVAVNNDERLSPRQVDCIKLVARGMTSWEIASVLGISDQTVSEYLTDARRRLAVSNRAQLVLKSLKLGYFTLDDVTE